jgi:hypothetical protein
MKIFWSENSTKAYNMDDELFNILLATEVIMMTDDYTFTITNNYNTKLQLSHYIYLLKALKKYYVLTHQVKSLLDTLSKVDELTYKEEHYED